MVNAFIGDFTARQPKALGYVAGEPKKIASANNEVPPPGGEVNWDKMATEEPAP